jgi:hypothetical protein
VQRDAVAGASDVARLHVEFEEEDDGRRLQDVIGRLVEGGVGIREATPEKATLEDVFAQLTAVEAASAAREAST